MGEHGYLHSKSPVWGGVAVAEVGPYGDDSLQPEQVIWELWP